MNPNPNQNPDPRRKLSQRLTERALGNHRINSSSAGQTAALEFSTPEDLLRYDAVQTEVPDRVAERLKESIRNEPPADVPQSWWKRLFGG